ncbi:MAG: hypothetical protein KJ017_04505 [Alphaproteobacteria bacterium]|nr:hypothetical protein [Alphaproteobacteria bacterium]
MRKSVLYLTLFFLTLAPFKIALGCIDNYEGSPKRFWSFHDELKLIQKSIATTPAQLYEEHYKDIETSEDLFPEKAKLAMQELLTGDAQKAVPMFLDFEKSNPEYASAASLGTAYELSGDNQNALKWIKEGLKRNPESHHRTEWLHVLILEAKINLEKNPDYYADKRVLELADTLPEKESDVFVTYNGQNFNRLQVEAALAYQLFERTVFVKPKDVIVADLLFSLSKINALNDDFETAFGFLDLSKQYGFKDEQLWQKTFSDYENRKFTKEILAPRAKIGFGVFLIAFIALWIWRDRKKSKKAAAS